MTVKELIKELLDCPMEAEVQIEVSTQPDLEFSVDTASSVEIISKNYVAIV